MVGNPKPQEDKKGSGGGGFSVSPPSITLPRGGGAIRGIGEKFAANPVTGTGSMRVPIASSPGRSGFGPQLSLSYDSGAGNGPFGFGWSLSLPAITRKTDKGLPQYRDAEDSDVFILSGAEDLVPLLVQNIQGEWEREKLPVRTVDGLTYRVDRYRPRIEGLFGRIERWTNVTTGESHWRSLSRDNILTLYGQDENSRIADPEDAGRTFSWLICETRDDKGNAVLYQYQAEDGTGVDLARAHERNRGDREDPQRTANRYLKRILYGNRMPLLDNAGRRPQALTPAQRDNAGWMFEVVFDYGEHAAADPKPNDAGEWRCRRDPFSTYRAGFEVRTYRLCRRVLMFHHFPEEVGVGQDCLVCSTNFTFRETPIAAFIAAVTQNGYKRAEAGGYLAQSLPPLEFEYSAAAIGQEIHDVDPTSLENLPYGVDGAAYQWVDLDGEGLSGILTEQGGGWFYKRNESAITRDAAQEAYATRFAPVGHISGKPAGNPLTEGRLQFLDLAGDGQVDLVELDRPVAGFYERTDAQDWEPFRPFVTIPNLNWNDPNLRFIDLTGDGHADVLITEDQALTWYPSQAEDGFGAATRVNVPTDEEHGPRVVFADGSQTIFLADLSGDGLTDIARLRNGEVCYWPNLGYGRFGAKVTMDDAPWFDAPEQFDPRRIRLADIDGSGVTDIIYLGRDQTRFWFNHSGNAWSPAHELPGLPAVDNMASVAVVDLLGNGTACLVWSSPLPGASRAPMKYLNLMAEGKPHLLVRTRNNLGAETRVHYAPSTYFYLRDQYDGKPWITKLPFPVHVVERVETYDHISRNRFVTRYAYHHGYFDGVEREFRGFGMVEQTDTEEFAALTADGTSPATNEDAASHVPPVLTRTWFHTGIHPGRDHISDYFAGLLDGHDQGEYYREPGHTDVEAGKLLLEDTVMPHGLTDEEEREACRALKGAMLRQEVYALDGLGMDENYLFGHPYTVSEQNFTLQRLQPHDGNRHAVFFTHPREIITYHYERNPADPRVQHALTLEVDAFGNVLKAAAIGYGRRQPDLTLSAEDQARQAEIYITYTENAVTHAIETEDDFRTPLPSASRTYELTGLTPPARHNRFTSTEMLAAGTDAAPISYEQSPTVGVPQKRLIEQVRIRYRPDDLGLAQNDPLALLPLGTMEPLALPGESYQLALTPGLLNQVYVRNGQRLLPADPADVLEGGGAHRGGYVDLDGDANWWIPSGRVFFSPGSADTATQELAHARQHFFLPHRTRDPFHTDAVSTESLVAYDAYDLLIVETRDALGNRVTVGERQPNGDIDPNKPGNDYRVLQPRRMMDLNRNRTEVAYDTLGLVVGTAVMGRPEENFGDSLDGFNADLTEADILDHLANPLTSPHALLHKATTRLVYDLFAYQRSKDQPDPQPAVVYILARETHAADLQPGQQTKIQHSFSYSDGFGREIQKKIQAEPGPVPQRDADGRIIVGVDNQPVMTLNEVSPRWVGSGWTIFNNKGAPVRQYEPFFTDTHRFEFDVRIGVSPVLFYDPVERVVATLHPNHTWAKVVFDPWRQETWDVSDTVGVADPKADPDVGDFFRRLPDVDYLPTWHAQRETGALGPHEQSAARKAAVHAATPAVAHADALGRTFLTIAHNRFKRSDTPAADPPAEELYATRAILDIEGNQREVIDARERVVMRYDYDLLGNRIHQASMEAGERWVLNDVAGQPLYAWDNRDHQFRTAYDPLRRPTHSFLREGGGPELLIGNSVYGETRLNPEANNLRGKVIQIFDQAGVVTSDDFDFKGNALQSRRQLARECKATLDWVIPAAVPLEPEVYTSRSRFDALNRPTEQIAPDHSVYRPTFNEANLLETVFVNLRGTAVATPFVADIDYDAKGQRTQIDYGNGVKTAYEYDRMTFRLTHLQSLRGAEALQDLHYVYDPVGNITHIRDDAQQTLFFRNRHVEPSAEYTYDANYRLIEATGREHLGQVGGAPIPHSHDDAPRVGLLHPGDGNAMGTYIERYVYDAVGNFLSMQHRRSDPVHAGWTRDYRYEETSLLEPDKFSNRLSRTILHPNGNQPLVDPYTHDAHGNMTAMPHLTLMHWDFRDQLQATARQVVNDGTPENTFYVYDTSGQRVRKITERQNGTRKSERIYLGGFEVYRDYGGDGIGVSLERESLHVMDDRQRIALVETRTQGDDGLPEQLTRYQFGNHLGSASLELDDQAQIISYEEYAPYGSTTYQAGRNAAEVSLKLYRYTGMERDEENGFNYHGARYYIPWLGRWTSYDPDGIAEGTNLFVYSENSPIIYTDLSGTTPEKPPKKVGAPKKPKLNDTWPYDKPVPDRGKLGKNVQRDHPIPVALRKLQRTHGKTQYHNRSVSAQKKQLTVLLETGAATDTQPAKPHTQIKKTQMQVLADVRSGKLTSESDLVARIQEGYEEVNKTLAAQGKPQISKRVSDRAILSDQATIHDTTKATAKELGNLGSSKARSQDIDKAIKGLDDALPTGQEVARTPSRGVRNSQRGSVSLGTMRSMATWGLEIFINIKLISDKNWIGLIRYHVPEQLQPILGLVDLIGSERNDDRGEVAWGTVRVGASLVAGPFGANTVETAKKVSENPGTFAPIAVINPIGLYNYVFVEGIWDWLCD